LSKSKKWLAVAEKHEKAPIISIYSTETLKKKRYIVSTDAGKSDCYISLAFSPTKEQFLVSMSNEPGQTIIIWQWDKSKCISM
jgi:WD40 repeat protein